MPRQSHLWSGRTAIIADRTVHEPAPPTDPDSPFVFSMEGQPITMTFGYPDATTIDETLVEYTGFALTTPEGTAVFTKQSASGTAIANCFVTYTPPAAANQAPTVVSTTSGC